ncbi:uncharacterized protein HD556DRAFT_1425573 [Suillus plorans]|uniref:Uncharacterized protein n=1 Tax=Suillus plorans TaxID=116603 RepID=A0A9P7DAN8_9AGAM|nr:uncharacterized protein HD556DRAFT_1425573 [Suillus plorans]KAG1784831.1 hypothetical protein HD556DRAFT_1425573 [Suillus plorans]
MSHPVMTAVEDPANDFITWSNDVFSYNVEQSRHDTHNLIVVLMREQDLNLQGALDYSCLLCESAIQRFEHNRAILASRGRELDKQAGFVS